MLACLAFGSTLPTQRHSTLNTQQSEELSSQIIPELTNGETRLFSCRRYTACTVRMLISVVLTKSIGGPFAELYDRNPSSLASLRQFVSSELTSHSRFSIVPAVSGAIRLIPNPATGARRRLRCLEQQFGSNSMLLDARSSCFEEQVSDGSAANADAGGGFFVNPSRPDACTTTRKGEHASCRITFYF